MIHGRIGAWTPVVPGLLIWSDLSRVKDPVVDVGQTFGVWWCIDLDSQPLPPP